MATRQNKKRKGRNNGLNRERTVTTLTEGPEGSVFLVPVPREDLFKRLAKTGVFPSFNVGAINMSQANTPSVITRWADTETVRVGEGSG